MNMKMKDMGIFNELSELISLRMKSVFALAHDGKWVEHKAHIDYDLWFIQSGIVTLRIDGIEHQARAGDVVFFYPGIPYMASTTGQGCRFIYVHFDFEIGNQQRILSDFPLSGIIPEQLIREETILFVKAFMQSNQLDSMPGNRLYLKACLMAVIAKIIELYGQDRYTGTFLNGRRPRTAERNLDVLQPVFSYIHSHLHKSIKMSELAQLVGISEKYFITYFKKTLGITPGQYIYQIKMNRARDYLNLKKYTIQEIASLLGYPDPFTFSKAFKKYYNVPPSKFD
ncbi:helix-turn-helix transcriptional regulator [Paenibacillus ihumii]|uniref:helix-turn-helix transcriptional regulator n=1 Tax=Paenibacillus ihumii TaxID=687436 RepID=UPI0006D8073B|nr:AraC family transcriptional regulator [Paenibacillus ihumii]